MTIRDIDVEKVDKVKKLAEALRLKDIANDLNNFIAVLRGLDTLLNNKNVEFDGSFMLELKDGVVRIRVEVPLTSKPKTVVVISDGMTVEDIKKIYSAIQDKLFEYLLSVSEDIADKLSDIVDAIESEDDSSGD